MRLAGHCFDKQCTAISANRKRSVISVANVNALPGQVTPFAHCGMTWEALPLRITTLYSFQLESRGWIIAYGILPPNFAVAIESF